MKRTLYVIMFILLIASAMNNIVGNTIIGQIQVLGVVLCYGFIGVIDSIEKKD